MNLNSKTILLLTPLIIIPILIIGLVSVSKLKEATDARLSSGIITLLEQISRQSFDAAFTAKENQQDNNSTKQIASEDEVIRHIRAFDLSSLKNIINTNAIGDIGSLAAIDTSGEILFLSENLPRASAENNLRLLGEKIAMEYNMMRNEIDVDGNIVFSFRKQLASGINVIAFLAEEDVINASYKLSKTIYVITIVLMLFVVVSVLMTLRYLIMKPIEALNAAAQEISNGNLAVDINIDKNDEIGILAKYFYDVSKNLKQTHEETNYLANHDDLTGLPNDRMFADYLENIIAIANTKKHSLALLFIKPDNLKQINDSYGQKGGDTVLKEMALRLNNSLRKDTLGANDLHDQSYDIVARIGADDFIVLLDNIDGPWDAAVVSDRILKLLQQPIAVNNEDVVISCNIGASVYPDDSVTAQELIKNADIAMYRAKENGKNHYQFYSDKTDTVMHNYQRIHSRLRNAIDDNQFFMDYQPKFNSVSGAIVGLEALIRWQDPEDGLISPDEFIPIAEDSGLISDVTKWVIDNVCKQGMDWYSSGRLTVPIAVNISATEFKRFDLLTMVTTCLKETGLPAELLELELTEISLQSGTDHVIEMFTSLKKLGVSVTLNNFGTGNSSLSDLNKLAVNTLKIDRSFVSEIKSKADESAIINAIIALGHALDLSIVADGVETEIQRGYLHSKTCDVMQGFLFSKPLSVDDITIKLDEALVVDA
ncbi:MAG: EAL domain-containing protein [Gammaproteobacteria bacterium]